MKLIWFYCFGYPLAVCTSQWRLILHVSYEYQFYEPLDTIHTKKKARFMYILNIIQINLNSNYVFVHWVYYEDKVTHLHQFFLFHTLKSLKVVYFQLKNRILRFFFRPIIFAWVPKVRWFLFIVIWLNFKSFWLY